MELVRALQGPRCGLREGWGGGRILTQDQTLQVVIDTLDPFVFGGRRVSQTFSPEMFLLPKCVCPAWMVVLNPSNDLFIMAATSLKERRLAKLYSYIFKVIYICLRPKKIPSFFYANYLRPLCRCPPPPTLEPMTPPPISLNSSALGCRPTFVPE